MNVINPKLVLNWLSSLEHVDNPYFTSHGENGFALYGFMYKDIEVTIDTDGGTTITPPDSEEPVHINDLDKITSLLVVLQ